MTGRRKILFLSHRVPFPPNKGDKIRTFHQLERLAASHDVYCACFVDCPEDRVHAAALRQWCRETVIVEWRRPAAKLRALAGLLKAAPMTLAAYESAPFHAQLAELSSRVRFDAVVAFSACMAPYAMSVAAKRRVVDLCDADSAKWMDYSKHSTFPLSLLYAEEGRRLLAYERECVRRFDASIVITERERRLIDPAGSYGKLAVIPNGIDLPGHTPAKASSLSPVVTFVGAMDYRPNVDGVCWFVRNVWPLVRACVPNARFTIVGRNPTPSVSRLRRVTGVLVTGEVGDVREFITSSRVVIAPLHIARGLQNKVLEAMAMRRPVVATASVAACMDATPDRHLLTADLPDTFARQIVQLCQSAGLCDRIAEGGYRYVACHHVWTDALDRFERLVTGSGQRINRRIVSRAAALPATGAQPATTGFEQPARRDRLNIPVLRGAGASGTPHHELRGLVDALGNLD